MNETWIRRKEDKTKDNIFMYEGEIWLNWIRKTKLGEEEEGDDGEEENNWGRKGNKKKKTKSDESKIEINVKDKKKKTIEGEWK